MPPSPPPARAPWGAEVGQAEAGQGADATAAGGGATGGDGATGGVPQDGAPQNGAPGDGAADWALRPATLEDVEEIAFAELELFPDEAWNVFQLAEEIAHRSEEHTSELQSRF